jgi:8-oxo-dGTP diphosphatase
VLVVAALIARGGEVLLTRRHDKGERAGLWEFPGGKVEQGEAEQGALARELLEELGAQVQVGSLYGRTEHSYPDLHVELALYHAQLVPGADPRPLQAAEMRWVQRAEMPSLPFCEADIPLLQQLARDG